MGKRLFLFPLQTGCVSEDILFSTNMPIYVYSHNRSKMLKKYSVEHQRYISTEHIKRLVVYIKNIRGCIDDSENVSEGHNFNPSLQYCICSSLY